MKRLIIILTLVLSCFTMIYGQTADTPQKPESVSVYEPIRKGDQSMRISIGPVFSLFNISSSGIITDTKMNTGGEGVISYTRFITSRFALGGGVAFAFNSTLAENVYFFLPVTLKASYEMVFGRIHVPAGISLGIAFQTYDNGNYLGSYFRPEIGVYYQYSPEWSFGLDCGWNFIPQTYEDSSNNRIGNLLDTVLGFRYHF